VSYFRHEPELKEWESEGGALEGRAWFVPLTDEEEAFLRECVSRVVERVFESDLARIKAWSDPLYLRRGY